MKTNHSLQSTHLLLLLAVMTVRSSLFGLSNDNTKVALHGKQVIESFDHKGVRLQEGPLKDQFEHALDFYLQLSNDDLLKDFRTRAKITPAPGTSLGYFYSESGSQLAQWLSGFARAYSATGNIQARDKANLLLTEWAKTIGFDGYFGPQDSLNFSHYTYDKWVGALVDMYEYCGNSKALMCLDHITDWAEKHLARSNEYALPTEWYTLAENLYRAYAVTGNERYQKFAKVWENHVLWDVLANRGDVFRELAQAKQYRSYHAYSTVNCLSSAAMAYRVSGEGHYLDTIVNGYEFLQRTQLYATGGYGPEEQLVVPDGLPDTLQTIRRDQTEGPALFHFETTCGSWAGFKLAKYLMEGTGNAKYGDWIERLLYNGVGAVLPTDEQGMIMYGSCYDLYGAQKSRFTTWFCCQGSLLETVAEYSDLIYFHDDNAIYVNLFVPSEVEWNGPLGKVRLSQVGRFPEEDTVTLNVSVPVKERFGIKIRVPLWASNGVALTVNGQTFAADSTPGTWALLDREWQDGDKVTLKFDLGLRAEPLPGSISPVAILRGPVVMVMTTVRDSEGGKPFMRGLDFPADWVGNGAVSSWFEANSGPSWFEIDGRLKLSPRESRQSTEEFRPFYDVKAGEFYRMYFERSGRSTIEGSSIAVSGRWTVEGRLRSADNIGSSFNVQFTGQTIEWDGLRLSDAGIATISIDGQTRGEVDQYGFTGVGAQRFEQHEVAFRWVASGLGDGGHTLRVAVTGKKNPESTGTKIDVSRLIVYK